MQNRFYTWIVAENWQKFVFGWYDKQMVYDKKIIKYMI